MKLEVIKKHLQGVSLFKELSDEEINHIVEISQMRIYKNRSFVFMQGEPLDRVFFIRSGMVKIHKTDISGKEQIVSILESGEMFPHAGFFRKGSFPAHAEVIETAELIVIPIHQFEGVLLKYPELCVKLFKVLGDKLVDLQNRLEEKILRDTYEQIIMLLLRLCKSNGVQLDDKYKITTNFTNRELGNMIGTTRETMSRTLSQLRKRGLIEVAEDGCFVISPDLLEGEINF